MQFQQFVPRRVAAHEFNSIARAIESFRKQLHQRFIRGRIHWWRRDFDSQFVAKGFADFVCGCARLDFDRQHESVAFDSQKGRESHRSKNSGKREFREYCIGAIETRQFHLDMNRFALLVSAPLLFLPGCASHRREPVSHNSQALPAPTPAAVQHAPVDVLKSAAAKPSEPFEGEGWVPFFDGKSLAGWSQTDFAGHGQVEVDSGLIVLNTGDPLTGINWTNRVPSNNYEVALDAMRVTGSDFFCGLTVPVSNSFCTLIIGGWGGTLVGISSLDGQDASENETTKYFNAEQGKWYRIRLRVTESRIEAWIDKQKFVDVDTTDKRISLRAGEIESSKPFGIASYQTTAAFREIKIRRVSAPANPLKKRY